MTPTGTITGPKQWKRTVCVGEQRIITTAIGNRIHQQLWRITTYTDGGGLNVVEEWRPVPIFKENEVE